MIRIFKIKANLKKILLVTAVSIISIAATVIRNKTEKKFTFKNVLILGNSITRHQPAPQLVLSSESGIYFLFYCEDKKLTATMNTDFMDLWEEDVVEVFLMPDEDSPVYFEYEISSLNYELPILISNDNGDLVRWKPFHYDADRKTMHATSVLGGEKKSNSVVKSWSAEFFIPYKLLRPLNNIHPQPGTEWRANLYRIDYDEAK